MLVFVLVLVALLACGRTARATPEAHILRIDPRAGLREGKPILTTVIEVVESRRLSEALQPCARLNGAAALLCWNEQLERPGALWQSFPFPEQNAHFFVKVLGEDHLARFSDKTAWAKAQSEPAAGTAWLVVVDAAASMGDRFGDARAIAHEVIEEMQPNDLIDLVFFDDVEVVRDTKWTTFKRRTDVAAVLNDVKSTRAAHGRDRSLFSLIKTMTADAFNSLANSNQPDQVPLHQAMVVLSNGAGGGDPESPSPIADVHQYLNRGRFPEDNTSLPKTPLPVVSIWLPTEGATNESNYHNRDAQFMQDLANPELGGFFDVVRRGASAAKARVIVGLVRARFNAMWLVHWTASCINASVEQSFSLVFENTHPVIAPDATFENVPLGIDPTRWPLDVDVAKTANAARDSPLRPGGQFTVYGDFCWSGDKERAEGYFLPSSKRPSAMETDHGGPDRGGKMVGPLQAGNMRGAAVATGDSYVTLKVPDDESVLDGPGDDVVVRVILYDNKTHRASAGDAEGILTLKGGKKPLSLSLVAGIAGLGVVVVLLVLVLRRGGGAGRTWGSRSPVGPTEPFGHGVMPTPIVSHLESGQGTLAPDPLAATAAAPGIRAPDPRFGQNYGAASPTFGAATISGAAGLFSVSGGVEIRVGRDPAQCPIFLSEPRVSGVHATLKFEAGQLMVRDENSNNGTWIYGTRATPGVWVRLPSGAPLRFGPVEFTVQSES